MAELDFGKELKGHINRIIEERNAEFDEILRAAQEYAWNEGYSSAVVGEPKLNNPYKKENI